ncbi:MAG: HD domain-containing protein [Chitinophagales bacterium]
MLILLIYSHFCVSQFSKNKFIKRNSSIIKNKKIINDPVYGFISIPGGLIYELIEHPYFQRLRRINQLGLTHYVYPGAVHSRFHHAIGAMHLMQQAIDVLRSKSFEISDAEYEAASIGILLHDIGHGPYSHTLERCLVPGANHEFLSSCFMERLNKKFDGALDLAISVFNGKNEKKYLHQLISGQLDVDRLDYLKRDSFFTGVSEGVIAYDRIIKMLNVHNNQLVVEAKGVYSVEKFLLARRLMYWQVYLHKTVVCAEQILVKILERAKYLSRNGTELDATPALKYFLKNELSRADFEKNEEALERFAALDDFDIFSAVKVWAYSSDKILSFLCKSLINRELFKIELQSEDFKTAYIVEKKAKIAAQLDIDNPSDLDYFVFKGQLSNQEYNPETGNINVLFKDGSLKDFASATDYLDLSLKKKQVVKYFCCYPR